MTPFKKMIVLLLVLSQLDGLGLSAEIQKSKKINFAEETDQNESSFDFLQIAKTRLTPFMNVGEVCPPSNQNKSFFIHIRDLHCNFEAQENIAKALEIVASESGIVDRKNKQQTTDPNPQSTIPDLLVLTEGADGPEDTSFLGTFPDKRVREEGSKAFMKEGKMTGPEFLSIARYGDIPMRIEGVEDADLYVENLKAFQAVMGKREETRAFVGDAENALEKIKTKVFSKELLEMDGKEKEFEKGEIKLEEYAGFLWRKNTNLKSKIRNQKSYPNFTLFIKILDLTKKISSQKVEDQRNAAIEALSEKLPRKELGLLIRESLELRLGKMTEEAYFMRLKSLIRQNLSSGVYPDLEAYIRMIKKQSKLNHEALLDEMRSLLEKFKRYISVSEEEKEVLILDRGLNIVKRMFRLEMTRENLNFQKKHREIYQVETIAGQLKKWTLKYEIALPKILNEHGQMKMLSETLQNGEQFYVLALKRDEVMAGKALKAVDSKLGMVSSDTNEVTPPNLPLENKGRDSPLTLRGVRGVTSEGSLSTIHYPQVTVLITGGFHSDGVTKILKEAGAGFIVLTPKISQMPDTTNYLTLMMDERVRVAAIDFFHIFGRKLAERFPGMTQKLLREVIMSFMTLGVHSGVDPSHLHQWLNQLKGVDREILDAARALIGSSPQTAGKSVKWTPALFEQWVTASSLGTAVLAVETLKELVRLGVLDLSRVQSAFVKFTERLQRIKEGLSALTDRVQADLSLAQEHGVLDRKVLESLPYFLARDRIRTLYRMYLGLRPSSLYNNLELLYPQGSREGRVLKVIQDLYEGQEFCSRLIQAYFDDRFAQDSSAKAEAREGDVSRRFEAWKDLGGGSPKMGTPTEDLGALHDLTLLEDSTEEVILRNPLLLPPYVGYAMAVKRQANPDNRDLVGLYGGAGADVSSFLLSTNAVRGYFVSMEKVNAEKLKQILEDETQWEAIHLNDFYVQQKMRDGFGHGSYLSSDQLHARIVQELKALGVNRRDIRFSDEDGNVTLSFQWTYPGTGRAKTYSITWISEDISRPSNHPQLKEILDHGIDFYYQRAGLNIPDIWETFMPTVGRALRPGGAMITNEWHPYGEVADKLDSHLVHSGASFRLLKDSAAMQWWASMIPGRVLNGYGWQMNIRRKALEKSPRASKPLQETRTGVPAFQVRPGSLLAIAEKLGLGKNYSPFSHAPILEETAKVGLPHFLSAMINVFSAGFIGNGVLMSVLSAAGLVFTLAHILNERSPPEDIKGFWGKCGFYLREIASLPAKEIFNIFAIPVLASLAGIFWSSVFMGAPLLVWIASIVTHMMLNRFAVPFFEKLGLDVEYATIKGKKGGGDEAERPAGRLRQTQRMEMVQVQTMRLTQELEAEYHFLERTLPGAVRKAFYREGGKTRRFKKHGMDFQYIVLKKEDYQDEPYLGEILKERGGGFAHYSEERQMYDLIVDGDLFSEEFLDYAAVHEYGESIFASHENPHESATKLELEIAKRDRKDKFYLTWLQSAIPSKFASIGVQDLDSSLPERVKEDENYERYHQAWEKDRTQTAEALIEDFQWPPAVLAAIKKAEKINDQAETILTDAVDEIEAAIQRTPSTKETFAQFVKRVQRAARMAMLKALGQMQREDETLLLLNHDRLNKLWLEKRQDLSQTWEEALVKKGRDLTHEDEEAGPNEGMDFLLGESDVFTILNMRRPEPDVQAMKDAMIQKTIERNVISHLEKGGSDIDLEWTQETDDQGNITFTLSDGSGVILPTGSPEKGRVRIYKYFSKEIRKWVYRTQRMAGRNFIVSYFKVVKSGEKHVFKEFHYPVEAVIAHLRAKDPMVRGDAENRVWMQETNENGELEFKWTQVKIRKGRRETIPKKVVLPAGVSGRFQVFVKREWTGSEWIYETEVERGDGQTIHRSSALVRGSDGPEFRTVQSSPSGAGLIGSWSVKQVKHYPTAQEPYFIFDLEGLNKNKGETREDIRVNAQALNPGERYEIQTGILSQLIPRAQAIQDEIKRKHTQGILNYLLNHLNQIWLMEGGIQVEGGFGDRHVIGVNQDLFNSQVRLAALFHEGAHAYFDNQSGLFESEGRSHLFPTVHQYARGLGKRLRSGRKVSDLMCQERGLGDELFGDENERLSQEISRMRAVRAQKYDARAQWQNLAGRLDLKNIRLDADKNFLKALTSDFIPRSIENVYPEMIGIPIRRLTPTLIQGRAKFLYRIDIEFENGEKRSLLVIAIDPMFSVEYSGLPTKYGQVIEASSDPQIVHRWGQQAEISFQRGTGTKTYRVFSLDFFPGVSLDKVSGMLEDLTGAQRNRGSVENPLAMLDSSVLETKLNQLIKWGLIQVSEKDAILRARATNDPIKLLEFQNHFRQMRVQLDAEAIRAQFDFYLKTGYLQTDPRRNNIVFSVVNGQWIMKVIDYELLKKLRSPWAIVRVYRNIFILSKDGTNLRLWFWSYESDKSGFFESVLKGLGQEAGIRFLSEALLEFEALEKLGGEYGLDQTIVLHLRRFLALKGIAGPKSVLEGSHGLRLRFLDARQRDAIEASA